MADRRRILLTTSYADVDLHSRSASRTPQFDFSLRDDEQSPLSLLRCTDPLATCMAIKEFFLVSLDHPDFFTPGIVRMEWQDLGSLERGKEGWLLLAEDAAFLEGKRELPVTIMAVIVPGDDKVRWSYHILSIADLLRDLDQRQLLHLRAHWTPGTRLHARFAKYIRESFLAAVSVPHAPDYLNAIQITDCCPSIAEPETATRRLESNEFIYFAHKTPVATCLDLEDDRYLCYLEPVEREVASIAGFRCAEYLFVKRNFFRVFYELLYRSERNLEPEAAGSSHPRKAYKGAVLEDVPEDNEGDSASPVPGTPQSHEGAKEDMPTTRSGRSFRIDTPQSTRRRGKARAETPVSATRRSAVWIAAGNRRTRVRTDTAHQHWLEEEYGMKHQRAKLMIAAWRELGFLDESRYKGWIQAGGIGFCDAEGGEEGDGDGSLGN